MRHALSIVETGPRPAVVVVSGARGKVLRYVASVTRRRIRVGLAEVGSESPFAGLRGTDNQVAFTTMRYRTNPLVIQGPGAGLAVTAAGIYNDVAELGNSGGAPGGAAVPRAGR